MEVGRPKHSAGRLMSWGVWDRTPGTLRGSTKHRRLSPTRPEARQRVEQNNQLKLGSVYIEHRRSVWRGPEGTEAGNLWTFLGKPHFSKSPVEKRAQVISGFHMAAESTVNHCLLSFPYSLFAPLVSSSLSPFPCLLATDRRCSSERLLCDPFRLDFIRGLSTLDSRKLTPTQVLIYLCIRILALL